MPLQAKVRLSQEQRGWLRFKEMLADYSFSLQQSAFVMLHIQGSVCVLVSMLNRLYGWNLRRYTGADSPKMNMLVTSSAGRMVLQCPLFYYRDRVSHQLYLLLSDPSCSISDTQKAHRYNAILVVQGEEAFEEQQRIFGDLTDKASREVLHGDNQAVERETLRSLLCSEVVLGGDYFDFSRSEEAHAKQEEPESDYLDLICIKNTSAKENLKTGGYAKPGRKEDYQKEKQVQQVVIAAPQIGLFDDAAMLSERQASVVPGNQDIRSSLMDDIPANRVDMVRYRQLLALQKMGKTILNTLWSKMCN